MTPANNADFVIIPSTTRLVRRQDLNSAVMYGTLHKATTVIPPMSKEDQFYLKNHTYIDLTASINIQAHKFDSDIKDKELEEPVYNEEILVNIGTIDIQVNEEPLTETDEFKGLTEEELRVADSRINFFLKTLGYMEEKSLLEELKKAEMEEETGPMEVKEVGEGPSKIDQDLHRVSELLKTNLPKQQSRIDALTKYLGKKTISTRSDNLFDLSRDMFNQKNIDGMELSGINNQIRESLKSLYQIFTGNGLVYYIDPNEDDGGDMVYSDESNEETEKGEAFEAGASKDSEEEVEG